MKCFQNEVCIEVLPNNFVERWVFKFALIEHKVPKSQKKSAIGCGLWLSAGGTRRSKPEKTVCMCVTLCGAAEGERIQ